MPAADARYRTLAPRLSAGRREMGSVLWAAAAKGTHITRWQPERSRSGCSSQGAGGSWASPRLASHEGG